jgi:epoxyqueuosine reductase
VSRHTSQEVCPWNSPKFVRRTGEPDFAPRPERPHAHAHAHAPTTAGGRGVAGAGMLPGTQAPSLIDLLDMALDEAAWDSFSRGSAVRRSGRAGFARNVCVGLGNWGSPDAVPVLSRALSDSEPLVRAHAAWALGRVGTAEARSALSDRASVESEAAVLGELRAAMEA